MNKTVYILKMFVRNNSLCYYFFLIAPILGILLMGCAGCGGLKPKSVLHKSNNGTNKTSKNISKYDDESKNHIVFPPDFPKIHPLPDHIPKGEIVLGSDNYFLYLFDLNGSFIKKVDPIEFTNENNPYLKIGFNSVDNNNPNEKILKDYSFNQKKIEFEKYGINLNDDAIDKADRLILYGTTLEPQFDNFTNKINCFNITIGFDIKDKNYNTIHSFRAAKLYDYSGKLIKTINDSGESIVFSLNQLICISMYKKCSGGYEDFCDINRFKFQNFNSNYTFEFNPIVKDNYSDYIQSMPSKIILSDTIIQIEFINHPKILRIIVDPISKIVYNKEYDLEQLYNGKYKNNLNDFFAGLKLINGEVEDYLKYEYRKY